MKLKTILILLFAALFSSASFGQGTTHIVYDVSVTSNNPQMQSMQSMFDGSTMEMYSNREYCRANMVLGSISKTTTITDLKTKNGIVLISSMVGKMAMKMTPEDFDKKKSDTANVKVQLIDSTKRIAGYECKKAVLTINNGFSFDMWYTKDIDMGEITGMPDGYEKVPGTPLEFTVNQGPMKMTYTASKIELNTKVDDSVFDMKIPEGYKLTSMDDLKKMGGQ